MHYGHQFPSVFWSRFRKHRINSNKKIGCLNWSIQLPDCFSPTTYESSSRKTRVAIKKAEGNNGAVYTYIIRKKCNNKENKIFIWLQKCRIFAIQIFIYERNCLRYESNAYRL